MKRARGMDVVLCCVCYSIANDRTTALDSTCRVTRAESLNNDGDFLLLQKMCDSDNTRRLMSILSSFHIVLINVYEYSYTGNSV